MVQTRGQSRTPSRSASRSKKTETPATNGSTKTTSSTSSSPATPTPAPRRRTRSTTTKKSLLSAGSTSSPSNGGPRSTKSKMSNKQQNILAPKTEFTEFGGPIGGLFVSVATPFFSYLLFFFCNEQVGCSVLPTYPAAIWQQMVQGIRESIFDTTAFAIYFGWYAFVVACWAILPGKWVKGSELRTGTRLDYKLNAFNTLVASFIAFGAYVYVRGPAAGAILYDHWPGLVTASLVNAIIQSLYVYALSFQEEKLLAKGGNTGNHLFDWFIGRELNPRIGSFDIKTFNELRPGMILWGLLDFSCACHQYVSRKGGLTDSMVLVVLFHTWYIVDALFNEESIFTQMDITTDGFGFMLSVGDLTWVPFVYSLQARFLAFMPNELGYLATAAILFLNLTGYYIFRTANSEKDEFRKGGNPKNLKSMTTSSGRKLITSGWWGRSRHPNYFGDWIMALSWCLPTGFLTPIPYFYIFFFVVLLTHRQLRDDEACKEKYGKDWDKYQKLVPSRIIPYIY